MKVDNPGRHLNILDYALRNLKRNALKNYSIFCVFSLVVFLLCSFQLMNRALIETSRQLLAVTPDITVQQMSAGRQESIDVSAVDRLNTIFGIKKIRERIWGYYFDESNGANYTVLGLTGSAMEEEWQTFLKPETGRLLSPGENGKVIISENVRDLLRLGERRYFSLFRPDLRQISFETVGIFTQESEILTADMIVMGLEDARELFAISGDQVTDLLVYVANPNEIDTVAKKISDRLPSTRVITKNQILKTYKVAFNWRSGLGTICLLTALFTFGIMAWDKASGFSEEDRREIGILKVLGWQTGDLITLRFYESLVTSVLAFFCGYLLAWLHIVQFNGALLRPVMLGFSVLRPLPLLVPTFAVSDMLLVAAISVLPYLCATAVPTWRAATVKTGSVL